VTPGETAHQPVPGGHDKPGTEAVTARGEPAPVVPAVRPLNPRVAALGGGHGLFASLSALRRVTRQLTAIVTVADDGGSSGMLRRDFGVLPPGDLRMALAPCGDDAWEPPEPGGAAPVHPRLGAGRACGRQRAQSRCGAAGGHRPD
jgi:hypothetical protein